MSGADPGEGWLGGSGAARDDSTRYCCAASSARAPLRMFSKP